MAGPIVLTKGSTVNMTKSEVIKATCTWSSHTDYDLFALVLKTDGTVETVATFGAGKGLFGRGIPAQLSVLNGAVRHLGDVGRESQAMSQEIIEIRLSPEIRAIVPVAYSAQSNGSGSFRRYQVSLCIDNGQGEQVTINSDNANQNDQIYSCAIGIIEQIDGKIQIRALESYSKPRSENRPTVSLVRGQVHVEMDAGPKNDYK
jgi:tellurite resistance protein TerA